MLFLSYDEDAGIIITKAQGLSSSADFDSYLSPLNKLMNLSVARHGCWLHLVDATDNPVQSRENSDHVADSWNAKPREDGYTAYVVRSVLAKMQIQRMRENVKRGFFDNDASARAWLLEQVGKSLPDAKSSRTA